MIGDIIHTLLAVVDIFALIYCCLVGIKIYRKRQLRAVLMLIQPVWWDSMAEDL